MRGPQLNLRWWIDAIDHWVFDGMVFAEMDSLDGTHLVVVVTCGSISDDEQLEQAFDFPI